MSEFSFVRVPEYKHITCGEIWMNSMDFYPRRVSNTIWRTALALPVLKNNSKKLIISKNNRRAESNRSAFVNSK